MRLWARLSLFLSCMARTQWVFSIDKMTIPRKIMPSPVKVKYLTSRNGLILSSGFFRSMRFSGSVVGMYRYLPLNWPKLFTFIDYTLLKSSQSFFAQVSGCILRYRYHTKRRFQNFDGLYRKNSSYCSVDTRGFDFCRPMKAVVFILTYCKYVYNLTTQLLIRR